MDVKMYSQFFMKGETIDGFFDALESMDQCTTVIHVAPETIGLRAVLNSLEDAQEMSMITFSTAKKNANANYGHYIAYWQNQFKQAEREGKVLMLKFDPDGKSSYSQNTYLADLEAVNIKNELLTEDLLKESKMLMVLDYAGDRHTHVVSPLAYSTLLKRVSIAGRAFYRPSISRTMNLFRTLQWGQGGGSSQLLTLIIRGNHNGSIVLAAHAKTYTYIPQLVLKDVYEEIKENLGNPECEKWYVSHEVSVCYINFPEVAKEMAEMYDLPDNVVPGICIQTSDSGDSSLSVGGYWSINGKIVGGKSFRENHRGSVDIPNLALQAGRSVFAEFNKVPERLCELLTIDVPRPADTLKDVFKQIGTTEIIGKHRSMELYDALCAEFVKGRNYTAYDIAISVATLADRCENVSRSFIEKLEQLANKAIFANYKPKKKEPEIILT